MEGSTASGDGSNSAAAVPDPKRLKSSPASDVIDRLSALPEALIVHILSLLPTLEDKVRTGALARKWQYLWTSVPNLYFNFQVQTFSSYANFFNCVNKTLILCAGPSVKSFGVSANYRSEDASVVNTWTRFASRNEIENFQLDLIASWWRLPTDYYLLPQHLFLNSSFRELRFCSCRFALKRPVSWNSLKKLSISGCMICSEALGLILAGTPALEILDLSLIRGTYVLHLGKSGLKKLIVFIEDDDRDGIDEQDHLEITAPSVQSLQIGGWFHISELVDMASLVEADLTHLFPVGGLTQEFLNSLLNVQTLTLGRWIIEGMTILRGEGVHPSFPKCKCLTVDTYIWMPNPSLLAHLLKFFPGIETLTVTVSDKIDYEQQQDNSDQYWTHENEASSYLSYLKTVEFNHFFAYIESAVWFVEFLLKKAKVLRKMTISNLVVKGNSRIETCQKLLSFPRSSPHAEILICE